MSISMREQAAINAPQAVVFDVIYNLPEYPTFISWCKHAGYLDTIHRESVRDAYMTFALGPVEYTLTTRNRNSHPECITLELISGPVKKLSGTWTIHPHDAEHCTAQLDMNFAWKNIVLQKSFGALFQSMCRELVHVFKQRAEAVHLARTVST